MFAITRLSPRCLRGLLTVLLLWPVTELFAGTPSDPTYYIGTPVLTEVWVDPVHGLDSRTGASRSQALRTITAAWNRIPPRPGSQGFRLRLVAGTYPEANFPLFWEHRHGSLRAPIIIEAADGTGTAHLRGSLNFFEVGYLYLIGLDVSVAGDVLHCERCDHVLIRRSTLTGGHRQAHETIKMNQSQYVYIEDSDIGEAYENAIDFVAVQYGHIVRNRIHDGDDWCLYLKGGSAYFQIEGNQIYHCGTGGFSAGQGTGFEYMVPPWLHYEAYALQFVNNVIAHTQGAGMGVNGGYDILLAYNTLYRVGRASHVLEFVFGSRSCDGDTALLGQCAAHLAAGGWGTTRLGVEGQPIPNRQVYAYNNLLYNPSGASSRWQHFAIFGPRQPSPRSHIPTPARTDVHLSIRGNLIWNGPPDHPLGLGEDSGCQPSHAGCNADQLRRDNRINTVAPDLNNPEGGDFRPVLNGAVQAIPAVRMPDFPAWARFTPTVPSRDRRNAVPVDYHRMPRTSENAIGAFARSDSRRDRASRFSEIFGTVTDALGQPVVDGQIELLRKNPNGQWWVAQQTITDALGHYHLTHLRPSAYRLRCGRAGYPLTYWPGVTRAAQAWSIQLPRATTFLVDLVRR